MKHQIRLKSGIQTEAFWNGDHFEVEGRTYSRDDVELELLKPFIVYTQTYEWYGNEDHIGDPSHGRYKPKGGSSFVVHLTEEEAMWNTDEFEKYWNAEFDSHDRMFREQFRDIDFYTPPSTVKFNPKTKGFQYA